MPAASRWKPAPGKRRRWADSGRTGPEFLHTLAFAEHHLQKSKNWHTQWSLKNALQIIQRMLSMRYIILKVHKIEIFFGFDFEICIISLLVMSKY